MILQFNNLTIIICQIVKAQDVYRSYLNEFIINYNMRMTLYNIDCKLNQQYNIERNIIQYGLLSNLIE